MPWKEFASLLSGLSPDTALGRIVAIRAETDREVIKNFSKSQYQIWSGWRSRMAKEVSEKQEAVLYDALKRAFINMAGGETGG